ncbi:uncharacterized protein LOC110766175 [Prunus avium]|uniref:Uncharacterized protein LOC110766175 n=1 Tax=Prunus avium TaxID=42229 RepID=A0A6P5TDD4_PRUAV|nr:uncharacterized protein LOC110766175 [Prunus avium]
MSNLRRVLERQEREEEEIRRRRAEEDREADEEEEEMLVAFAMLNESRQHHRRRAQNVDRRRQSRGKNLMEDYFIPNSLYPKYDAYGVLGLLPEQKLTAALRILAYGASAEQVDAIARMGKSTILECLVRFCDAVENLYTREYLRRPSPADLQRLLKKADTRVFNDVLRGHSPQITYQINNTVYSGAYYLADGIYPRWTTFVKTIPNPQSQKEKSFVAFQEGYRKDMERCFGILQARWAIIRSAARMLDEEDEYDYEATEEFEPDPMNTSLTRIYERPMGPNGHPLEHEPLLRDGRFNNPMIDRYQEMQSSYVHERRHIDLIEHLWEMKGNHNG